MELYYDHPNCKVYYVADKAYIHSVWEGFPPSQIFREGSNKILELMEKHKIGKLLVDSRLSGAASPDDQAWMINDWTPRAVAAGYRVYAYVLAKDIFSKFSSSRVIQEVTANNPVSGTMTDNAEDALAWLMAQ
jgi:hypothetical protein